MKGIQIPPRTEDFTADPVELFFDLAYVFAFSQLVGHLVHHPDWRGVGEAGLLFMLMWLPWSQFTWAANRVSGNGRRVRVLFLIGTAVSVPMAASVSTAFESGGPLFAITLSSIVVLGLATITIGFEKGTAEFGSLLRWSLPSLVALAVIVVGGFVDGGFRIGLWIAGVLIIFAAMVGAGRGEWIVRPGHFAERHGLIVIIALGEVVVAIGLPVVGALEAGEGLPANTATALVASGALAGLLWWSYFDRPSPALEHRAEALDDPAAEGRYVRDVYTWAHALIVSGVVVTAAALEEIALHPGDEVSGAFRLMFFGGLSLFIGGITIAVFRAYRVIPRERVAAAVVVGLILLGASSLAGVYLIIIIDLVILGVLLAEQQRVEG
ncbi:MAG: low temperature requirement protein A [Acidimicrobiales bacterium]